MTHTPGAPAQSYEPINIDPDFAFGGLNQRTDQTATYADYADWFALGAKQSAATWGGIPGPTGHVVTHVELHVYSETSDCSQVGKTFSDAFTSEIAATSTSNCKSLCRSDQNCFRFTFDSSTSMCQFRGHDPAATLVDLTTATSGPKFCDVPHHGEIETCGIPTPAPANNFLWPDPEITFTCQSDFVTYDCHAGGLNVFEHDPTRDSVDVECSAGGTYLDPFLWPVCIQSNTCNGLVSPANGRFVCADDTLPVGSSCTLKCDAGFISDKENDNTCLQDPLTLAYHWSRDMTEFRCSRQVAIVVGGTTPLLEYVRTAEVFNPSLPLCSGRIMADYPEKVTGAVSGRVSGVGVICGGARELYVDCRATNGGNACEKNAEYATTKGGARWYSGPKSRNCYAFQDPNAAGGETWALIGQLREARSDAAAVDLPDGSMWILGGLGNDDLLLTTEIVKRVNDVWRIQTGPKRLLRRVFGHCAVLSSANTVTVIGGFDSKDGFSNAVETYDIEKNTWKVETGSLREARYDHSCLIADVDGEESVMAIGGANHEGNLNTTEVRNATTFHWRILGASNVLAQDFDTVVQGSKAHLRRSAGAFHDGNRPVTAGGVACAADPDHAPEFRRSKCARGGYAMAFDKDVDEWETLNAAISQELSGHAMLLVPETQVCVTP